MTQQFDLFVSTNGAEGWDPDTTEPKAILQLLLDLPASSETRQLLIPFVHEDHGGQKGNKRNEKWVSNFANSASEWFTSLAKNGVHVRMFLEVVCASLLHASIFLMV